MEKVNEDAQGTSDKILALIKRWRSDANQYQKQVDEARQKNLPHDQMLSAVTFLRGCAKELEDATK